MFSELETDLLALLASIAKQIGYGRGDVLFNEQAPATALYVVLAGRIQMSRGGQAMFTVGPDDTIGNWALFDEQPSVVTATAEEDSWLLRIEQQDFFDLLADHSEITPKMFQAPLQTCAVAADSRVRFRIRRAAGRCGLVADSWLPRLAKGGSISSASSLAVICLY